MSESYQKRIRTLCTQITDAGGLVTEVRNNKHIQIRFMNPQGVPQMLILARTPSDYRASHNVQSTLRRLLAQRQPMRYVA